MNPEPKPTPTPDHDLDRLRRLVSAFDAISSDAEVIGAFSRSVQQDIRLQAVLWRRRLGNALQAVGVA